MESVAKPRPVGTRAYVGALHVAATLLALAVAAGTSAGSAQATLAARSSAEATAGLPAPQGVRGLFPGAGFEPRGGSDAVATLQRLAARRGYDPGPIDGRYGPLTEAAVEHFQVDHGLQADGIAGRQTLAALKAPWLLLPGAGAEPGGSKLVRDMQRLLLVTRFDPGPIDGRFGPRTVAAVKRFEAASGLPVDGVAAGPTFAELRTQARAAHPSLGRTLRWEPTPPIPIRPQHMSKLAPALTGSRRPALHAAPPAGSFPLGSIVLFGFAGLAVLLTAIAFVRQSHSRRRPHPIADRSTPTTAPALERRRDGVGRAMPAAHNGASVPERGANRHASAENAFNLGVLLEEQGDLAGAEAAYRAADEQGYPPAASNLGVLLEGRGDPAGAEAAYRRADERGEANGAFNLGVLLEEQHDVAGAEAAYSRADQRGHAAAASNLGVLLEGRGDRFGAEAAYRRADQRGEPNGAFNLGVLLEEQGDLAGAEPAYRRADQTGHAKVAQLARVALLDLGSRAELAAGSHNGDHHGP